MSRTVHFHERRSGVHEVDIISLRNLCVIDADTHNKCIIIHFDLIMRFLFATNRGTFAIQRKLQRFIELKDEIK